MKVEAFPTVLGWEIQDEGTLSAVRIVVASNGNVHVIGEFSGDLRRLALDMAVATTPEGRAVSGAIQAQLTGTSRRDEKPPVERSSVKPVSVIYHGSDGMGWCDHSSGPSAEHIAKLYDGGVVVVQQVDETVRVSVMAKQDVKPTSGRYRESDIAAMSGAIVDQVREHCGLWDRWPGSDAVARVAYDALYANVAKR